MWDPVSGIIQRAQLMIEEFDLSLPSHSPSLNAPLSSHWLPPVGNHQKINFDGAILSASNSTRIGVIVKDSHGAPELAFTKKIPYPCNPAMIEALVA